MLPRPQQRELCMLPIKCALKLVSCGVLRYNRLSVVRVLSIRPYKLTHRERCIEGHNRIHTLAESAEDQFFFLARSLALSIISRAGIFLFLSSCLWATRFTRRIPSRHVHWPHSFARPLRVLALAGWLSERLRCESWGLAVWCAPARPEFRSPAAAAGADLHHARAARSLWLIYAHKGYLRSMPCRLRMSQCVNT